MDGSREVDTRMDDYVDKSSDHEVLITVKGRVFGSGEDVESFVAQVERELRVKFGSLIVSVGRRGRRG